MTATAHRIIAATRVTRRFLAVAPVLEVGVDQTVQVSFENLLHIGGLLAGTQVLDHLVGVKYVGANLRTEPHVCLLPALRRYLVLALLPFDLEKPRPQHLHRDLAVLMLATLVLALRYDSGREMRDSDSGIRLVDVLPPRPTGPVDRKSGA